ncbi:YeeE/YedE family protein [Alcaligenes sp. HNGD-HTN06]|uniref:YeeE/YedE family protein n=1 Tax=Alcaligenes sp. HNGD-HTN06 TaxID=3416924 RepID=UPI003CEF1C0A
MMNTELVLWVSLAIGLLFGMSGQLSGFCFYRGLTERWSGRSGYKLQGFALALAVALAGTQLAAGSGLISLDKVLYLNPTFSWLLVPVGGVLFGMGMTLANGCGARALILLGQGNLRSFVVLLCLGIAAYMTLTGLLAPLRMNLAQVSSITLPTVTLPAGPVRSIVIALLVAALIAFSLRPRLDGQRLNDLLAGAFIGLLIVAGWLTTGWLGDDPFEPVPVSSLSFVAPIGESIQYAMISTGMSPRFTILMVAGVLAGSCLSALLRRRWKLEGFESPRHMLRAMTGGTLMGVGGVLALGCTIGQGLSGLSTLSATSLLAVLGIVIGSRLVWARPNS